MPQTLKLGVRAPGVETEISSTTYKQRDFGSETDLEPHHIGNGVHVESFHGFVLAV